MRLLPIGLFLAILLTYGYCNFLRPNESGASKVETKLVRLSENNFVVLRGEIDSESSSQFISDILKLNGDTIYIYLFTPGGSIIKGNDIIQTMNTLQKMGKEIICVADQAYSMGFIIFEACPTRYIMSNSILMQHQASLDMEGPIEQVKSLFKLLEKIISDSVLMQSKRMELTKDRFNELTQHDLWMYGEEIIQNKAGDEIVNVICDFDMTKSYSLKKHIPFGVLNIEFSLCPLIHVPRNIELNIDESKIVDQIKSKFVMDGSNKI